jgi:NADH-quinone oxidoreductase subunit L
MTHAFFKALLFMAAGIVIHALSAEQDIRKMGGVGRMMPLTYRAFIVGALALAAVPPFAGFFSKDAILGAAANSGTLGWILWAAAAAGAFLTAVYTFRLLFIVFWGEPTPFVREHLHLARFEGGVAMAWPVAALVGLSLVGGWIEVPGGWKGVDTWIHPVAESVEEPSGLTFGFSLVVTLALALAGIAVAWLVWGRPSDVPERARRRFPAVQRALEAKLYFDDAYDRAFYDPADRAAVLGTRYVEEPAFLASLAGLGRGVRFGARRVAGAQTGFVRSYALALAAGAAVLAVVFLVLS